jgi:hypothetical protein
LKGPASISKLVIAGALKSVTLALAVKVIWKGFPMMTLGGADAVSLTSSLATAIFTIMNKTAKENIL